MQKQTKEILAFLLILTLTAVPLVVFALDTFVTINLSWNYSTQGFSVYADALHTQKYTSGDFLALGMFNESFTSGSKTFWIMNEGNSQISVFPHSSGTNIVGFFSSVEMVLGVGAEASTEFIFTVEGSGSGQVWFNTSP